MVIEIPFTIRRYRRWEWLAERRTVIGSAKLSTT